MDCSRALTFPDRRRRVCTSSRKYSNNTPRMYLSAATSSGEEWTSFGRRLSVRSIDGGHVKACGRSPTLDHSRRPSISPGPLPPEQHTYNVHNVYQSGGPGPVRLAWNAASERGRGGPP